MNMESKFKNSKGLSFDSEIDEIQIIEDFEKYFLKQIKIPNEYILYDEKKLIKIINGIFLKKKFSKENLYEYIHDYFKEKKNKDKKIFILLKCLKKYFYSENSIINTFFKILLRNENKKYLKKFFKLNNLYIDCFGTKKHLNKDEIKYYFEHILEENLINNKIFDHLTNLFSKEEKIKKINFIFFISSKIHEDYGLSIHKIKTEIYYIMKKFLKKYIKKILFFKFSIKDFKSNIFNIIFNHCIIYWKIIYFNNKRLWKRFFGNDDFELLNEFQNKLNSINFKDLKKIEFLCISILKNAPFQDLIEQLIKIN